VYLLYSINVVDVQEVYDPALDDQGILHLRNVSVSDIGWYSCKVSNDLGSAVRYAYVDVQPRPTNELQVQMVRMDDTKMNIGLICGVAGLVILVGIVTAVCICRRCIATKERIVMLERCPLYQTHPANVPYDAAWEFRREK